MTTTQLIDEVAVAPGRWRVYAEGWQSWSPATCYPAGVPPLLPEEPWQHVMRYRPGTELHATAHQAEGLAVIDPGDGGPARVFVTADLDAPATITLEARGDHLVVRAAAGLEQGAAPTVADALVRVGDRLGERLGARTGQQPRVWCSWYRYFEAVTADHVRDALVRIRDCRLPVEVVQVDDGWSTGLGDGLRVRPGFGDLRRTVGEVRDAGLRAGLWLAPFLVGRDTEVARDYPGWLTGDAGRNWGQDLVGLDLLHPGVQDLLRGHLATLRELGVDYLKLDFLYAGALTGPGRDRPEAVAAYRAGLSLIRQEMGEDCLLLGCGAPILPSVGLVDAMRVSPDTFHEGADDGSGGLRGLMSTAARAWMHGRLWTSDPDVVVARPSFGPRDRWAQESRRFGGLRSWSDRWDELDEHGRNLVVGVLSDPAPSVFDTATVDAGLRVAADEVRARGARGDLG
jgi:alpha-galactosidase